MVIATFGPGTGWRGKTILYQAGQFVLEDYGKISAKAVLNYDRQGYLEWPYDGLREWVKEIAASKSTTSSGTASSKTSPVSSADEQRPRRARTTEKPAEYEIVDLAHVLREGEDLEVRAEAAIVLGSIGSPEAIEALAGALADQDHHSGRLSDIICDQLAAIGEPAVPALTALLDDKTAGWHARYTLKQIKKSQASRVPDLSAKRGIKWYVVILVLAAIAVAVVLASQAGRDSTPGGGGGQESPQYTYGQYSQIQNGMNMDEVDAITGGGATRTESQIGGSTMEMYMYGNDDGSSIAVSLVDGVVVSKAEAGLR